MTRMNIKDLATFPAMYKWHTSLSRSKGGLYFLKEEDIWLAAKEVWERFPNCKIARSYVLFYWIAKKVVEHAGDNTFIGMSGGLHSGVREELNDTLWGVERKDWKSIGNSKKVSNLRSDDRGSTMTTSTTNNQLSTQIGGLNSKATTYADVVRNNVGRNERMAVSPTLGGLTGSEPPISS